MSGSVHASCVLIGRAGECFGAPADAGVLLLGQSGCGKSDLSLQLIARGAILVADDRTELVARGSTLFARAPKALAGLIEVRGIGIIEMPHVPEARLALVIQLVEKEQMTRFPQQELYAPPSELALPRKHWPPLLRIAVSQPSVGTRIAAAVAAQNQGRLWPAARLP